MGKYSYVKATNLKNDADIALKELSNYDISGIRTNLKRGVLDCEISDKVDNALKNIDSSNSINGSITNLKSKLKNLKSAAEYIIKYQDVEDDIAVLRQRLYNKDGSINYYVQAQINSKNYTLSNYEMKIDRLLY